MIAFIDEVPVGEKNIPIDYQRSNLAMKNPHGVDGMGVVGFG